MFFFPNYINLSTFYHSYYFREVPPLLLKEANVSSEDELHVSIEDHRYEEYVPSKPKKKVFAGSGNLLGR